VVGVEVNAGIVAVGVDVLGVIVGIWGVPDVVSDGDGLSSSACGGEIGEQAERTKTTAITPKKSSFRLLISGIGLLQFICWVNDVP
jgi:hypothetical protein